MNQNTIDSLFSRHFKKVAKAYNVDPATVTSKSPEKKFSSDLGISTKEVKSSTITPVAISNPGINPQGQNMQLPNQLVIQNPYNINEKQVGAFCDSLYNLMQAMNQDLEELSKDEKSDLGDLWTPFAQKYIQSDKGLALLAVGGTSGMMARKIKDARRKKKERENENTLQKVETTTITKTAAPKHKAAIEKPEKDVEALVNG